MKKESLLNNLMNNDQEKVIKTPTLNVQGHLLRWKNVIIQISNISMMSTTAYTPNDFPFYALAGIIAGLLVCDFSTLVGILIVVASIYCIWNWGYTWYKNRDSISLRISLNSGRTYSILFAHKDFLDEVLSVFAKIFEDGGKLSNTEINIDVKNCTIDNKSSIISTLNGKTDDDKD